MTGLLLDLFCGAGGAAKGYHLAGFDVVGVDIEPMPRYPFQFVQAGALNVLDTLILGGTLADCRLGGASLDVRLSDIDAIHASPPCQGYSITKNLPHSKSYEYLQLIEPVRAYLQAIGLPYVIENVPRAPLLNPVTLCGSQFDLTTDWPPWGKVILRRHRLFESGGFTIPDAGPHDHSLLSVPVYGHGPGMQQDRRARGRRYLHGPGAMQAAREVMQIDWMTRDELDESIPPAYTEYIGTHLAKQLRAQERQAA